MVEGSAEQGGLLNQLLSPANLKRAQRLAGKLPPKWSRRTRELGKQLLNYRGARSTASRGMLFRLLGRFTPLLATRFGEGMLLVDTADEEISRVVFVRGEYERIYMQAALDCLREQGRPVGPLFLDVGANIGVSAIDALLHFGFTRAVCFEPDSRSFRLLRMNAQLNSLEDRLEAHRIALSDSEGDAVLHRYPDNYGNSRLLGDGEPSPADGVGGEPCTTCRLDTFLQRRPELAAEAGLLWVDTQGHEAHVLAGSMGLLDSGVAVVAEYWPKGLTGHGALERFEKLVAENFTTLVDLRRLCAGDEAARMPASEVGKLREHYLAAEFTDLLLIK